MYKIVVVDDELIQCRGVKNILKRFLPKAEVETFDRADIALEYIKKEHVQIIITDICMPEMDGLSFTEKVKEVNSKAKIVLLTGFAEFEYARKAIELGAFEYLLKPLDPDKLRTAVVRAAGEIAYESEVEQQQEKIKKKLDKTLSTYIEKLLNQWVCGWISPKAVQEIEKIIPHGENGFVLVSKLYGLNNWKMLADTDVYEKTKEQLGLWIRQKMGRSNHALSFFSNVLPETLVTIVICDGEWKDYPKEIKRGNIWRDMAETDENKINIQRDKWIMGVGQHVRNLTEQIKEAYDSAMSALMLSFYFPCSKVLWAENNLIHHLPVVHIGRTEENLVRDAFKEQNGKKASDILMKVLDHILQSGYPDPEKLKNSCENFLHRVFPDCEESLTFYADKDLNYEELRAHICNYLDMLSELYRNKKEERCNEFSIRVKNYMESHFEEDISLEDVAAYFKLTTSYCSAMIKANTGKNFSQSLIELRVGRAKELLENTNLRIYEISEKTGYKDVKYFNRVFKKETGITPIQYREGMRKIQTNSDSGKKTGRKQEG